MEKGRYVTFSGICINYSLSFVGAATMLTIEGIVQNTNTIEGANTVSYWFKPASVCWVDTELKGYDASKDYSQQEERAKVSVDGKWVTAEISRQYGKIKAIMIEEMLQLLEAILQKLVLE